MKGIEIVTHCYSGDAVPIYHRLLVCQLSSLLIHQPKIRTKITVCCTGNDLLTEGVLDYFEPFYKMRSRLWLVRFPLSPGELFRRAIGRNRVALKSAADVIWFTDVDHVFGKDCVDVAYNRAMAKFRESHAANMVHPETVKINKTHELGDAMLERLGERLGIVPIDPKDFEARTEKRAWGGLQIVRGDWARNNGYLDEEQWQTPVDPDGGFRSCKGDMHFRKRTGPSQKIEVPELYRIRHSRTGRDSGKKDHGEKTKR